MGLNYEAQQIPFVRIVIPLVLGIIIQLFFPIPFHYIFIIYSIVFAVLILIISTKAVSSSYRYRWVYGLFVNIIIFLFAVELVNLQWEKGKCNLPANHKGLIIANIIQSPIEGDKTIKAVISIESYKSNNQWNKGNGKAIIYFQKDSLSNSIEIGDQIVFDDVLSDVKTLNNPDEFDYKKYLSYRLITKQAYIKSNNWKIIKKDEGSALDIMAVKWRNYLLNIYKKYGLKDNEFAVASALTVGYTDKLDTEIKQAYSSSGAMHVLSVSGLHVGILFAVLNYLLFFFNGFRAGRIIKAIFIFTFIWVYSILTGMHPAIMRATLMFSFIIIGKILIRNANIYNSILASAFILLVYNPFYIIEVGFQLSYIAVIGIVFYQRKFYNLLYFKNWLPDKIWALITVSVAAQLVTFPICLYYFHQFPNYFLLTNIIVIPLGIVILYSGISLVALSFFNIIASVIAKGLFYATFAINYSVLYIERLPFSITQNISISTLEVFILYLIIILITAYLLHKNIRYLQFSLITIILLISMNIYHKVIMLNQKQFIIYNISGLSAYNFISETDNVLISNVSKSDKEMKLDRTIKNNCIALGLTNEKFIDINDNISNKNIIYKDNFIGFYNKRFMIIRDEELRKYNTKEKTDIDYLVLANNNKMTIKELSSMFNAKQIIIDSSNPKYKADKWADDCKTYNINCWNVSQQGAFIAM